MFANPNLNPNQGQMPVNSRGAEDLFPQITGSASIGVSQWWQNPAVLIGGTVVAGLGIWALIRATKK